MNLKARLAKIETRSVAKPGHVPITEIHRTFLNADGSVVLDEDGNPVVHIRKVKQ